MPRPTRYAFNDWLFSRLRVRYVLVALLVALAAGWVADKLGWMPAPAPARVVERRPGY